LVIRVLVWIAFVQELRSVVGEYVPAKTAVFLEEMMNKEGSRECQLLICVNSADWEPQFICYCERSMLDDISTCDCILGWWWRHLRLRKVAAYADEGVPDV
nr:hypothetical protein [Tanacetum cinerariifolium]